MAGMDKESAMSKVELPSQPTLDPQVESGFPQDAKLGDCTSAQLVEYLKMRSTPLPYAGRLGGNQEFVLDPSDPDTQGLLNKVPDAAPWMSYRSTFSFAGFKQPEIWKPALIEGIGTMMLCYITILLGSSPALNVQPNPVPTGPSGVFGTADFIGPLVGSVTNIIVVSLFIFSFSVISGGHLNPLITIGTFMCRLTTFPRMILYVGFQMSSASLAGLLVRGSMNSTHWKAGGCFYDPNVVSVRQMFTIEFTSSLTILFLAFGVGLDPRQASTFGPALAPILVGISLGVLTLASAFTIPGYGGAGMNPGRCFAVWVGSGHSLGVTAASGEYGYTGPNGDRLWIYWVTPIIAAALHAVFYLLVPPWSFSGTGTREVKQAKQQQKQVDQESSQV